MELFLLRALERLIAVIIGGLSIYLGYRLFIAVKATGEGSGEVKLPGDMTVILSRVGPGVFFALFGALVVGASLAFPVRYSESELSNAVGANIQTTKDISGFAASPDRGYPASVAMIGNAVEPGINHESMEIERLRVREHIAYLNQVQNLVEPILDQVQQQRVHQRSRAVKLYLMHGIWDQGWGRFDDFQLWAEGGGKAVDSAGFRTAMALFEQGQEVKHQ